MAVIKKYTKKDGSTAYMFNTYLGVDPLTGKSKRTTRRGFKTPKEAKLALAQLQLEYENNDFVKQDYSTFKEVYELWFENYKLDVKASSSLRVNTLFKNRILPKFEKMRINKINSAFCQRVVNEWNEANESTNLRSYTKRIFQYAISLNLISLNPMNNIVLPRKKSEFKPVANKFLNKNQLICFLDTIKQNETFMNYLVFHFLAYTGLRKGELAALTWDKLNLLEATVTINKTAYYLNGEPHITSTKTNSSNRTISLDAETVNLMKIWKLEQKKSLLSKGIRIRKNEEQLVFSNNKNELLHNSFLNQIIRKYPEFTISPHAFRHTHASLLFEAGASIKQVQERLGHSSINTTLEIYTHVTKETEKETADKFLNYMSL